MNDGDRSYLFKSDLFEIEAGEEDEVNPRMYGRQLTNWLRDQLIRRGRKIEFVSTEDWGRCIMCANDGFSLWVGAGSRTDYESAKTDDPPPLATEVVWNCFVAAEIPFWMRFF